MKMKSERCYMTTREHSLGDYVRVDLSVLVESVFVAPSAPPWFEDLVRSLVERFGFAFPIRRSRLGEDPVY